MYKWEAFLKIRWIGRRVVIASPLLLLDIKEVHLVFRYEIVQNKTTAHYSDHEMVNTQRKT